MLIDGVKKPIYFTLKRHWHKIPQLTVYGLQISWQIPQELLSIQYPKPGLSLSHGILMEDVN